MADIMPIDHFNAVMDKFSVVPAWEKKMSEKYDILTPFFRQLIWAPGLFFYRRSWKVFYRLRFGIIYLFLNFTFLGFDGSLVLRNDQNWKKTQDEQDDCQCPCWFLKKISCFPDPHKLVGWLKIRCQSSTLWILNEDNQNQ